MKGFSNFPENFCVEWVQMRKYLACVFYMPIVVAKAPTKRQIFWEITIPSKNPPRHLLQPSLKLQLIPLS